MVDSPQSGVSVGSDVVEGRQRKRIRIWTAEDRAKHRVLEKERREAFSDNLLLLARSLPALADVKESKLSKHTIVEESLKYHQLQQKQVEELQDSVATLTAERDSLVAELNQWRQCLSTISDVQQPQHQKLSISRCDGGNAEEVAQCETSGEDFPISLMTAGLDAMIESTVGQPMASKWTAQQYNQQQDMDPGEIHSTAQSSGSMYPGMDASSMSLVPDATLSDSHTLSNEDQPVMMNIQPYNNLLTYPPEPSTLQSRLSPGDWDSMIQAFADPTFWTPSISTRPSAMQFETCLSNFQYKDNGIRN